MQIKVLRIRKKVFALRLRCACFTIFFLGVCCTHFISSVYRIFSRQDCPFSEKSYFLDTKDEKGKRNQYCIHLEKTILLHTGLSIQVLITISQKKLYCILIYVFFISENVLSDNSTTKILNDGNVIHIKGLLLTRC